MIIMRKVVVILWMAMIVVLLQALNSCKHEFSGNHCQTDPLVVTLTTTDATLNQNNGTIRAIATGGSGFRYSLNGAAYQDSGYFTGLQPFQSYTFNVTNSWGFEDSSSAIINV
jgi:hypothetical protein